MAQGVSDYGGRSAGPLERSEHELGLYEKRVDALLMLVSRSRSDLCVDAHRRAQEQLSQQDYDHLPYYDRWVAALRAILVEAGVLSDAEIERRLSELRRRVGPQS